MREIKFRGRRVDTGEWVYGKLLNSNFSSFIVMMVNTIGGNVISSLVYHEVDQESIGQYTGLKDKKGVEIYERDVVDTTYNGEAFIGVVVYDMSELDFKATNGKENYGSNFQYLLCCEEVEVIGNIYENPELLEVEANA